jgi:uncharacterized protein YfiM (DUF2279 family)
VVAILSLSLAFQAAPAVADSLRPQPKPLCIDRIIQSAQPDRWLAMDKFWHFSASFATVGAGYHLCANRLNMTEPAPTGLALAGTFAIGLTKEFCDLAGPARHFSLKDLVADLAGIGAGYLVFIHQF